MNALSILEQLPFPQPLIPTRCCTWLKFSVAADKTKVHSTPIEWSCTCTDLSHRDSNGGSRHETTENWVGDKVHNETCVTNQPNMPPLEDAERPTQARTLSKADKRDAVHCNSPHFRRPSPSWINPASNAKIMACDGGTHKPFTPQS